MNKLSVGTMYDTDGPMSFIPLQETRQLDGTFAYWGCLVDYIERNVHTVFLDKDHNIIGWDCKVGSRNDAMWFRKNVLGA